MCFDLVEIIAKMSLAPNGIYNLLKSSLHFLL
ncbi:protein of unknown function [Kingella kingae]|nr:protein of unknown function [Kingella kingae]